MTVYWENTTLVIQGSDEEQWYDLSEIEQFMMDSICPGVCTACGCESGVVEPDARHYTCDNCGEAEVHSVIELTLEAI